MFATSLKSASLGKSSTAAITTPGPETPTFSAHSGSEYPVKAPAINGLSFGALQKQTNFAAPNPSLSAVNSAAFLTISDIFKTASMLIPALELATFTEEQIKSVVARASGMLSIKAISPLVQPFSTSAEKPPIKFTFTAFAASFKTCANFT